MEVEVESGLGIGGNIGSVEWKFLVNLVLLDIVSLALHRSE